MSEENTKVAKCEYERYMSRLYHKLISILWELLSNELICYIVDYGILDKCEHFEMVIQVDPETFAFVWIYNRMLARRNWAHDLQPRSKFISPEHISHAAVRSFNDGPLKMLKLAEFHGDAGLIEHKGEGFIISAFKQGAARICKPKSGRKKYANICTQEYAKYLNWMTLRLLELILFPREVVLCIIGYAILDECEHFEATIRIDATLFSFVFGWNDIHHKPEWYKEATSRGKYVYLVRISPGTMKQFNDNVMTMMNETLALAMYGNSETVGRKKVCIQFRENASRLLDKAWPIGMIIR